MKIENINIPLMIRGNLIEKYLMKKGYNSIQDIIGLVKN